MKRPLKLTIGQLLPAGAGRVAAIYTDPARPSYDECIQQNRKALGQNILSPTWPVYGVWSQEGDDLVCNATTNSILPAALAQPLSPGVFWVSFRIAAYTSGNIRARVRQGGTTALTPTQTGVGWRSFLLVNDANSIFDLEPSSSLGFVGRINEIRLQRITDWSQLVLFNDVAGTDPVFDVREAKGLGLLLDRSFGLVRGPERATDLSSGWVPTGAATITSATSFTTTSTGGVYVNVNELFEVGKSYEVVLSYTKSDNVSTLTLVNVNNAAAPTPAISSSTAATGSIPFKYLNAAAGGLYIRLSAAGAVTGLSLSVREIPGNHLSQPTAAARGEFSARYNLATNTEFTTGLIGAAPQDWIESGGVTGRVISDMTARSGRALRVVSTAASGFGSTSDVRQAISGVVAGSTATVRISAKAVPGQVPTLRVQFGPAASVDLALSATYTWYTLTFATSGTTHALFFGGGDGFAADVDAVDIRLTADAIPSIPAYQAVRSATDYDDVGFPVYHRQQTDDWAKSHMNPNGATKAYVFWAGQKMSDAALGAVVELGTNPSSGAGNLSVLAPATAGPTYRMGSKGSTALVSTQSASTFPAPIRSLVVGVGDIANDVCSLTVNSATTTSATDQGTGAYTEQDVFFGSRAGTSLFANTREPAPPLILFMQTGDTINPSHVARLQAGYAKAAGVTL